MGGLPGGEWLGGAGTHFGVVVDGPAALRVVVTAAEVDGVRLGRSVEERQGAGLGDVAADLAGQADGSVVQGDT